MTPLTKYPEPLVFGLDIGTRSIVGTVGYREGDQFNIVAQSVKFHDTRAMLDGQIHDIAKVAEEIIYVKNNLEKQLPGRKLKEVCIAAAGRVLKTAVGKGVYEFSENTVITQEHIHSLESVGVEQAHEKMVKENDTDMKFYCVGYTVIKYYLNGYEIGNLEGHKAHNIATDVLATFLPEEVVDGLYSAVTLAGLEISNMTLEPIAAIQVAIPESYRLLNIALIDVGAGTSDICITKDGSIVGYGMLPEAGDKITECLIQEYLVDFDTAEEIKMIGPGKKSLAYKDIMGISHKVTPEEVYEKVDAVVSTIAKDAADRIIELNGGKPVSAVFVVGGGGKIPTYTVKLAEYLGIPEERVAVRGEEVLGFVNIFVEDVTKDSLLVTPIGICLNFYDQKNNFIFVHVNEDRIKLYNNDKLTVFDAALGYGLSSEDIFPKRGDDLHYTLNNKPKFVRGAAGEPANIKLNGNEVGMNHEIVAGDQIEIEPSSKGEPAKALLNEIVDLSEVLAFEVNDALINCPRYASVNGRYESEYYEIAEGDKIELLNYYTLDRLMQFMDIETPHEVFVNGARATADTKIYENFKVAWIDNEEIYRAKKFVLEEKEKQKEMEAQEEKEQADTIDNAGEETKTEGAKTEDVKKEAKTEKTKTGVTGMEAIDTAPKEENVSEAKDAPKSGEAIEMHVIVNGKPITLEGKKDYVFVDIFEKYEFDLKNVKGTRLIQTVDGQNAQHFGPLHEGAVVEIYWKD